MRGPKLRVDRAVADGTGTCVRGDSGIKQSGLIGTI